MAIFDLLRLRHLKGRLCAGEIGRSRDSAGLGEWLAMELRICSMVFEDPMRQQHRGWPRVWHGGRVDELS